MLTPHYSKVGFDMDRIMHLITASLMALTAVIILGPGAPSILAQHAARQAFVLVKHRRTPRER